MKEASQLFTVPDAAIRLGVSQSWLAQEIDAGRLPALAIESGDTRQFLVHVPTVLSVMIQRAATERMPDPEGAVP